MRLSLARCFVSTLLICTTVGATSGCEMIASVKGLASAVGEIDKHLEKDLKAPLTNDKISLLLRVAPKLKKFSETAKVKWEPNPNSNDMSQLANAMGGLSDYMAFFEANDTRITEFYVLLIKVSDARAQVLWKKGHAESMAKLDKEREELEAKKAAAEADKKAEVDEELKRNKLAREKLDEVAKKHSEAIEKHRKQQANNKGGYTLNEAEIGLVEARIDEVGEAFVKAGFDKNKNKSSEAKTPDEGTPE